jgi:LMBR1 domain-containing protein 1
MLTVLAINVFFYCVSPQYAKYGSQHYLWHNATNVTDGRLDITLEKRVCDNQAGPQYCTMTRNSAMLTRFFFKAWVFGAIYYWATWAFIGVSSLAFMYVVLRKSKSVTDGLTDDDDLEEDEDDNSLLRRNRHR